MKGEEGIIVNIKDLIRIYEKKKGEFGPQAYRHISNVLKEAKEQHKQEFKGIDHEQSWRAFKGKNLEKLIEHIIIDEVRALGLEVVNGNTLERTNAENLSKELSKVKRNLLIDYSEFGYYLPDVDLIIYKPATSEIFAVDGTLRVRKPAKKGRAIVEIDTDGSYVLSESDIEESDKVKMFDKFIDDLKRLLVS